uniref:Glycosyl hydrolase family 57 n=1 Tax=Candidatus Kentrum sp. DK TaxID=2126562 RepID=A0A450T111_9GAMM|nr:MAG: Glycosyl hydrolase family 57 [Candidatus Kentron sp. DK]
MGSRKKLHERKIQPLNLYILFHLNLSYSSIEEEQRPEVITHCYHPLLDLAEEHDIPIGVELTGWTLRAIKALDPAWVRRLYSLLHAGRCELVGSGYTQMVGPLVPWEVNLWNQTLGLEVYAELLDIRPQLALVNEMAYSSGMVDLYRDAGYRGIVMDGDNIRLALDIIEPDALPSHATSGRNRIPVLWSDSILFQKFQRYAHGDIGADDYLGYFRTRAVKTGARPLPIYCNDAEIFDFRPGRFREEARLQQRIEWQRITQLLLLLRHREDAVWLSPSQALDAALRANEGCIPTRSLCSAHQPLPVKKQAKYNISRWAISGRDDLWLNSLCHRLYRSLAGTPLGLDKAKKRQLCELWASDLRTHITERRWEQAIRQARRLAEELKVDLSPPASETVSANNATERDLQAAGFRVRRDAEDIYLRIDTDALQLVLNLRRGLTLHSLAFRAHGFTPLVGTLPHGYFHSIELGADFYCLGVIIEKIIERHRVTDLERVTPGFSLDGNKLTISAEIVTPGGPIQKTLHLVPNEEELGLTTAFPGWSRPDGTVRVGTLTLLPEAFDGFLRVETVNGGPDTECFDLKQECLHPLSASNLVSCRSGLGSTDGWLRIGDAKRGIEVSWDPADCAAFPMLYHKPCPPGALTRVHFSLGEIDETFRSGGNELPALRQRFRPWLTTALKDGG